MPTSTSLNLLHSATACLRIGMADSFQGDPWHWAPLHWWLANSNFPFVMICNYVDTHTLGAVPMNGRAWGSSLPGHLVPRSFNHSPPPPPPLPSSRWGWQGNWSGLMGPIEGCQQGSGGDGSLHTTLDQSINLRVHLQCVRLCLFVSLVYACVKGGPT